MKNTILLFLLFTVISCEKGELFTEGEVNAQKLSSVISNNDLTLVTIYSWEISYKYGTYYNSYSYWEEVVDEKSFNIQEPFIVVNSDYYNLANLDKFSYSGNILKVYLK
jgi:hypothetical protein